MGVMGFFQANPAVPGSPSKGLWDNFGTAAIPRVILVPGACCPLRLFPCRCRGAARHGAISPDPFPSVGNPRQRWEPRGCSSAPVSHVGLGITSWEKSPPLQPADPAEDYPEGVAGRRGEQSHCLEGTALFEMLFKALDDSQQQLEGISSW